MEVVSGVTGVSGFGSFLHPVTRMTESNRRGMMCCFMLLLLSFNILDYPCEAKAVVASHHGIAFHHFVLYIEEIEHLDFCSELSATDVEGTAERDPLVNIAGHP